MQADNRCWICLGSGDERPPLGSYRDAHDWVHPCKCSLRAHRKCLLEWVSTKGLESKEVLLRDTPNIGFDSVNVLDHYTTLHSRRPGFQPLGWLGIRMDEQAPHVSVDNSAARLSRAFNSDEHGDVITGVTTAMMDGAEENQSSGGSRSPRKFIINTLCPQCNTPILLRTNRSTTLWLTSLCSKFVDWSTKTLTEATVLGTIGGSILFSCAGFLMSWGLRVMTTIAPESTMLKLLDLSQYRTFIGAFNANKIGFRQISLLCGAPLYLLSFRYDNTILGWLRRFYPISFLKPTDNLHSSTKRFLLFQFPLKILYDCFVMLCLNPIYFNWIHRVKPYFISDRMSIDQMRMYEKEQSEIEYKREMRNLNSRAHSGIWCKLKSIFSWSDGDISTKVIRNRRLLMILRYNYTQALVETSSWEKLASAVLWPSLGKYVNVLLLMKFSSFKRFLTKNTDTSDDALYLGNLIGCCAVVLANELVHLYITWKRVQQLENLQVLEYMSSDWEYLMNKKTGQVINQLGYLPNDPESELIVEEHARELLEREKYEQWGTMVDDIPTVTGKVSYLGYLVMKQNIERSLRHAECST